MSIVPIIIGAIFHVGAIAQIPWQRTYGGFDSNEGRGIDTTSDGGFVVVGSTGSFGQGGGDMYLLKLDSLGALQWSATYGGVGVDRGAAVRTLSDGGFAIAGTTASPPSSNYDGWLIRTDATGALLWEKRYGGPDWELLHGMTVIEDGFLLTGQSYGVGDGSSDIWLIRTDLNGDTIWTRSFGSGGEDIGYGVTATVGLGIAVGGQMVNAQGNDDAIVLKYSWDGTLEWVRDLGGDSAAVAYSVATAANGDIIIGGFTESFGPDRVMYLARVDALGDPIWSVTTTGGSGAWEGRYVRELSNGDLLLAGFSEAFGSGARDVYLFHTSASGDYIEGPTFGGGQDDEAWGVIVARDGAYVLVGSSTSFGPGLRSVYVIRNYGSPDIPIVEEIFDPLSVQPLALIQADPLHPNPASPGETVRLQTTAEGLLSGSILDVTGKWVSSADVAPDGAMRVPSLPAGVYSILFSQAEKTVLRSRLIIR